MRPAPVFRILAASFGILAAGMILGSCVQEPEGVIHSCKPPAILEIVPKNGGEDFDPEDTIIFAFEEPVDSNTVDTTTVFVIETGTGDTIHGDVFPQPCDELGKRGINLFGSLPSHRLAKTAPFHDQPHPCGSLYFFDPTDPLKPGDTYTVIITTGVTDTLGDPIPDPITWTFTTKDTLPDPPPGIDVYPEPGDPSVPLDQVITVTLDTVWNPTLFDDSTIILTLGTDTIIGTIAYDPVDSTVTFTPADSLLPDTTYTVTITVPTEPGGPAGPLGPPPPLDTTYTFTFTTEDPTPTCVEDPFDSPPHAIQRTPAILEDSVDLNITIVVTFNEPMEPASINNNTFRLFQYHDGVTDTLPGTVTLLPGNTVAKFVPLHDLLPGGTFQSIISSSARDAQCSPLDTPVYIPFTTAVPPPTVNPVPDNQNASPALFNWTAVRDVVFYHLQISTNPGFTSTVQNLPYLTGTSRSVSGLVPGTTYYWRMRVTVNAAGTSGWTPTYSFIKQ